MRRLGWLLVLCGSMLLIGCTFRDTSKEENTRVSGENRQSPPPAGVTEDPGAPQSERP